MPSGDAAIKSGPRVGIPDRMQFQSGNDVHQRQWFPDERDAFISWLRAEFAAANAIIDSLCYHLRCIGDPGEYEVAIGCIQQRRSTWTPVLHMQQYFSVADVVHSLQQVAWRRQPRHPDPSSAAGSYLHPKPEPKKPSLQIVGGRHGNRSTAVENARENHGADADSHSANQETQSSSVSTKKSSANDISGAEVKPESASSGLSVISSENNEGAETEQKGSNDVVLEANGTKSGDVSEGHHKSDVQKDDSDIKEKQDDKQNGVPIPKTFMNSEILDGKAINIVEGLELYEDLFDSSEISKLFSLANELRAAGRRGELQGQTFVPSKRPMKGRGREALQFGVPIIDGPPEDDKGTGTSKDRKVEQMPSALQDIADRLIQSQVMNVKPDSCIIDFFNEGDHSQPHMCPPWFVRPFCGLVLTKCIMVFGRVINIDHPGDYRGSLRLSLSAGSLLVMKGKSADFAKHAIPSIRKQRIIVTFTKSQPKRLLSNDGMRIQSSVPPAPWVPTSRLPNMIRHPNPKHYNAVPSTGVLPVPPARPQHLPASDMQPIFVGSSVAPAVAYPPPPVAVPVATTGWSSVTRPPPPRMLVPGTGVFLPPAGPGHSSSQQQGGAASGESNSLAEPACENQPQNGQLPERNNDKLNTNLPEKVEPKGDGLTGKGSKQESEENMACVGKAEGKEEQSVGKKKQSGKTSGQAK
ncbi:hypothetical protein EJ110_NYTH01934 [Nymphaea thermarum]|nr:hypothetical protein EJ110_NYTH01934 [Nymphaea thermarum]